MEKKLSEMVQDFHPLTRPTLKNCVRMIVYPKGVSDFTNAFVEDLNIRERVWLETF